MPSNEGWDSVFLQALQNSLAQSKAENKWNQELAFRDKEFEQKKTEFDWTKAYNEKQLEQARIQNLADYGTKFASLGKDEIADWNKNFGSMYGMGGDNPYTTDVVENNWVPYAALGAKENTRQYEQKRLEDFFSKYSKEAPTYKYDTAQQIALTGSRLGSTVDTSIANKFGFPVPDPTATYYLNDARQSAGTVQGSLEATDRNNAAAASRMWMQIANENANLDKQTRGYYKVYIPGKNGKPSQVVDAPNMTLSEIEKVYGKNAIIEKIDNKVGFNSSLWNNERNNLEGELKSVNTTAEAIAFIEALQKRGMDVSQIPEVRSKLLNIIEDESIIKYNKNPKQNIWGQIADYGPNVLLPVLLYNVIKGDASNKPITFNTGLSRYIPGTDKSYREAINQGDGSKNYYRAKDLLNGLQGTGMNTNTTLNQGY